MPRQPADERNDAAKADVGLVCALPLELDSLFALCERTRTLKGGEFRFRGGRLGSARVAAVESGPGRLKAARATRALIDGHAPDWIISCGFGGALVDGMRIGDVAIADSVRHLPRYTPEQAKVPPQPGAHLAADVHAHTATTADSQQPALPGLLDGEEEVATPTQMPADPAKGLYRGRFVTTPGIVRTVAEKRWLAARYQAVSVDMETFAVANVCQEEKVPFLAIRAMTDDLSADLPDEVHALLTSSGARRIGATLGALWNRPESAKDLWKLREQAGLAGERLARFLLGVIAQLHAESLKRHAAQAARPHNSP